MDATETQDAAEAAPASDPGARLGAIVDGRYRLDLVLGCGGMGVVYEATQLAVGRRVAVKELPPERRGDPRAERRFEREARALASLQHPHVVPLIDFGIREDGSRYLVMERLEGRPLSEVITEGPIEPRRVQAMAMQMLRALSAAHAKGIIHRDIKPSNVFVSDYGDGTDCVRLLDFGIAKRLQGDGISPDLTGSQDVVGSPRYLAPEQATTEPVTARTDLYALGLVLWEMLVGRPVFEGDSGVDLLVAHASREAEWPAPGGRALSGPLPALVMACLRKKPWERPESADAAIRMLQGRETLPPAEPATMPELAAPMWRRVLPWGLAAALVIGVVAGVAGATGADEAAATPRKVEALALDRADLPGAAPPRAAPSPAERAGQGEPAAAKVHKVRVTSRPEGAIVQQDGQELGPTPLTVEWRGDARPTLVLRREGFEAAVVRLDPVDARDERVVELRPSPEVPTEESPATDAVATARPRSTRSRKRTAAKAGHQPVETPMEGPAEPPPTSDGDGGYDYMKLPEAPR